MKHRLVRIATIMMLAVLCMCLGGTIVASASDPFAHPSNHGYNPIETTLQWLRSGQGYVRLRDGTNIWVTEGARAGYEFTVHIHNTPGTTFPVKNARKLASVLRNNGVTPMDISLGTRILWSAQAWGTVAMEATSMTIPIVPYGAVIYPSSIWRKTQAAQPKSTS